MPKDDTDDFSELCTAAVQFLEQHPGAVAVHEGELRPSASSLISAWETQHGLLMPDDLRNFYLVRSP
jgi:hypothetical protein